MPATGCAVMMRSIYNNGGLLGVFQVQCIWAKFTHLIWIYWLLMWYFVFLSNFGICYKCTRIVSLFALRIAIHIGVPVSPVYRCIVSALIQTQKYFISIKLQVWESMRQLEIYIYISFLCLCFIVIIMMYIWCSYMGGIKNIFIIFTRILIAMTCTVPVNSI